MEARPRLISWVDDNQAHRKFRPPPEFQEGFFIGRLGAEDHELALKQGLAGTSIAERGVFIFKPGSMAFYTGLLDKEVEQRHVLVKPSGDDVELVDHGASGQGSTAGITIEGGEVEIKRGEVRVKGGFKLKIGRATFTFQQPSKTNQQAKPHGEK